MSILQKLHQGISMSLGAQEQSKHGDLGRSLSQLFHNIVVTLLDDLQNFLHFLFGGVLSNFLWYFWLSRMSHWFFPTSWGYWLSRWNASWSRGVFRRRDIWREHSSGSGHLTRSGDVVNVRNGSFNCKVFNSQRVLLDAMIVNISSIIPRDRLVRGIWTWSSRGNHLCFQHWLQGLRQWHVDLRKLSSRRVLVTRVVSLSVIPQNLPSIFSKH